MNKVKVILISLCMAFVILNVPTAHARQVKSPMYFGFEPDITTNYQRHGEKRNLGFVRVAIEAMVATVDDMKLLEYHQPLIRDAFIRVINNAPEDKIRSLNGREEILQSCLEEAQMLLERETGREVIIGLIFTKYIYE